MLVYTKEKRNASIIPKNYKETLYTVYNVVANIREVFNVASFPKV